METTHKHSHLQGLVCMVSLLGYLAHLKAKSMHFALENEIIIYALWVCIMASRHLVEICISFTIYQRVNNLHLPTYSCSVQIVIFDFLL